MPNHVLLLHHAPRFSPALLPSALSWLTRLFHPSLSCTGAIYGRVAGARLGWVSWAHTSTGRHGRGTLGTSCRGFFLLECIRYKYWARIPIVVYVGYIRYLKCYYASHCSHCVWQLEFLLYFMNTVVYNSLTSSLFFCDISRQYFTALSVFLGTGFSRVITAADLCTVKRARESTYLERMAGSVHGRAKIAR